MLAPLPSPLAIAVDLIFHGPPPESNSNIHILDYQAEAVFRDLWLLGLESDRPSINGLELNWKDGNQEILIIGNDPPDGIFDNRPASLQGINFRDHFTATSWLAAWKVKFPDAKVSIAAIDVREAGVARGAARALQMILGARDVFDQTLVPRAGVLNAPSLEAICHWVRDSKTDNRATGPHIPDLLKSSIWNELTSNREEHHALSNVMGAFLLSSQVGKGSPHSGDPWAQDYILALVQACGVSATTDMVNFTPGEEGQHKHQTWISRGLQERIKGAVLIDDMADVWEYFLRGALGFYGREAEQFLTSPHSSFTAGFKELPARLQTFLQTGGQFLTADVLISGEHKLQDGFVLFLDLRLFPIRTVGAGDGFRVTFLKQLAEFGLKLLESGRNLPWLDENGKHQLSEELRRVVAGIATRPPAHSAKALPPEETLLPRLLSLLDPTLPIIIFSSTHRTELVDPFRHYGSIITTFRKPILTGMNRDWSEIIRELHSDFALALEQAAKMLRVRGAINTFHRRTHKGPLDLLPRSDHGHLIEVFLDESEEPTQKRPPRAVCAGGIVVVRALDSGGTPIVSDTTLFQKLAASNCLWGWCAETPQDFVRPCNAPQQRGFMPKGAELKFAGDGQGTVLLEGMVSNIRSALGEWGCIVPFAAIGARTRPFPEWMEVPKNVEPWTIEKILDATLRRLVQHAIEGLLFRSDILRSSLAHPNSRIAIDLGIRDYPCRESQPLFESFGFEVWRGWRPSFHSEDGYQVTAETISRTGVRWPFKAGIVRARAVPLRDFGNVTIRPNGLLPKQLHYFADTVSHVALDDLDATTSDSPAIKDFFASGWITDFRIDPEEESRLAIGRAWDQGDRVEAVLWAANLKRTPRANGLGIDIYQELSDGTGRLAGPELMQLMSRL